ncbi:hypothetical protein CASFOL_016693 [Castilleja foliolosa]|uniref:Uncharacterized protein n=1 Tax=Castilleja foliolosa TaxID=1961234 RepID=A0ABD3DCW3_9LAMI
MGYASAALPVARSGADNGSCAGGGFSRLKFVDRVSAMRKRRAYDGGGGISDPVSSQIGGGANGRVWGLV